MASLCFDLVKRKVDETFVCGRRGRRLSNSKMIILLGVDLEKIMQVLYSNFLIYKKKPCTKSTLFCIYCKIALAIVLCFSSYSFYVAFRMHLPEFVSSLVPFFMVGELPDVFHLVGKTGLFHILDEVFTFCFTRLCQGVLFHK